MNASNQSINQGGAERLVVDSACCIQSKGYQVVIYTTNHPLDHCFPETKNELKVEVLLSIYNLIISVYNIYDYI